MLQSVPYNIRYSKFNTIIPVGEENIDKLREAEKQYDEIGIANYNTNKEGFSMMSFMGTITACLTDGKRLGVDLNKKGIIERFILTIKI